ncbi:methyltransferase [Kitasatospora purpeofusca]|uniref:methyltransferase n=1 Tax=Kitasatospora purpeofusca TaxID=67352 RepID=UPI00368491C1
MDGEKGALTPVPLMQLASGFWSFKVFAAAVELGLFTRLRDGGSLTLSEAARELGIHERGADMFLASCASVGLLDKEQDRYRNTPLAEEFLVEGRRHYFGGFVRYCDQREYPAWHRLVEAMRTNRPLTWDPATQDSVFSAADPVMMEFFWEAMHSISSFTASALAQVHDFRQHLRLLDVGGGSGAYPIELCRRHTQLSATLFDLPHVASAARARIEEAGLDEVIETAAGDFRTDPLPGGHDVVLLSLVLHDWDEETGRGLLRKCWDALEPGGTIVICELLLNPERTGPPSAALMGMNMVVELEGGRNYSETEYLSWLTDTGFTGAHVVRLDAAGANGAVIATK